MYNHHTNAVNMALALYALKCVPLFSTYSTIPFSASRVPPHGSPTPARPPAPGGESGEKAIERRS